LSKYRDFEKHGCGDEVKGRGIILFTAVNSSA